MAKKAVRAKFAKAKIIDWLASKRMAAEKKMPTDREFAEILNVSTMTISNVLKELEAEAIIRRIPRRGTFVNTPIVKPRLVDIYFPAEWRDVLMNHYTTHHSYMIYRFFFDGIMNACSDLEISPMLHYVSLPSMEKYQPKRTLGAIGAIFVVYGSERNFIPMKISNTPYVHITVDKVNHPNQIGRDGKAIQDGLTHLYQLGHRHFGIFGLKAREYDDVYPMPDQMFFSWTKERHLGVRDEDILYSPGNTVEKSVINIKRYLERDKLPSAIFSGSHIYTRAFLLASEKLGIKVPDDISIITNANLMDMYDLETDASVADPLSFQHAYEAVRKLDEICKAGVFRFESFEMQSRLHIGKTCSVCKDEWFQRETVVY